MSVWAIIAAAGQSNRMHSPIKKQFMDLGEKPILVHTLDRFDRCPIIDGIDIVVPDRCEAYVEKNIVARFLMSKVGKIITGGATRQESVRIALNALAENVRYVAIHDAARPLLSSELLLEVLQRGMETGAAILAMRACDSLKQAHQHKVEKTLDRSSIWLAQTPQVFEKNLIIQAHEQAGRDRYAAYDDSELVERLGHPVAIIESNFLNFKITTPDDLDIARNLIDKVN